MSRFQLSLNVSDVEAAVTFYTELLGVEPAKHRDGYANFVVSDPPLKLVLIEGEGAPATINHVGIEVADSEAVVRQAHRLAEAGLHTRVDPTHTCCYATQDKVWVADPDGTPWEVYNVIGDTGYFGAAGSDRADLAPVVPIERDELIAKMGAGTVVLIDAQGPGWYDKGHLPGAHAVDWDDITATATAHLPSRDTEIVVYCWNSTCSGSETVAAELTRLGYRNVRRYIEGKQDWQAHGQPLAVTAR
ncbi:ArsI/CadI family heavy metal resistance metalloenzyme [Nocardia ninae]|uniref:Uncharacterized protein n=1 Tax=Nocardia ninae NBRC 108245 TaxID=1210091 RepID=A0A511M8D9_9NOCA|nr:ArsI/CadI family heavy metal resistance metalloenzyme [Nocardia ninae]GEM36467.1 hypothetical protein NN4_09860 [Nocardia ninae NBRC 108245]